MESRSSRSSAQIEWIPLSRASGQVIARPTLTALATILLRDEDSRRLHHDLAPQDGAETPVVVQVREFPQLDTIGGIARLDRGNLPPIGIARIGRASYAAYRPADLTGPSPSGAELGSIARELGLTALVELDVAYDESEGTLRVYGDKA